MPYQPPRFDDLYGPYNSIASPAVVQPQAPPTPTPPPTAAINPFHALITALLTPRQTTATQQQQIPWHDLISAVTAPGQYSDPVGYANKVTSMPSYAPGSQSPFNTGFFQTGASVMTPAARLASEGRSATAQWGLRGGVQGIDPKALRDLMR